MLDKEFGKFICLSSLAVIGVGWLMPFLTVGTATNPIPALVVCFMGLMIWKVFNGEQDRNRCVGGITG